MIIGLISKIITTLFKAIYTVISLFNLQLTLLIAVVGVILFITGVLTANPLISAIVGILFILSIIYAVLTTIKKLLGIDSKIKKGKGAQTLSNEKEEVAVKSEDDKISQLQTNSVVDEKPKYFRVKNSSNYVMAEFNDRYELYKITENGLVRQRVDYK